MRALHNTTKNSTVRQSRRTSVRHGRRFVSLLLCLFMTMSMLCNFGICALSSAAEATGNVMNRIADGDTTDSYKGKLLSSDWGSRYAGRVWTDKSVFAYAADGENAIGLDMGTDGYKGTVDFNADFAHVFSALASSQIVNTVNSIPLDVVLLLDISTSMTTSGGAQIEPARDTVRDANNLIDTIMGNGDRLVHPNNRISVVVYGGGSQVVLPLGHYKANSGNNYLSIDYGTVKSEKWWPTVSANVTDTNTNEQVRTTSGQMMADSTYLQGALYQGMNILSTEKETTYKDANGKEQNRSPVLIVLTDGGTNVVGATSTGNAGQYNTDKYQSRIDFWEPLKWASDPQRAILPIPHGWPNIPVPNGNPMYASISASQNYYDIIGPRSAQVLLTAGYMKKKVEENYNKVKSAADPISMKGFGIGLNVENLSNYEKAQLYATMDPKIYIKAENIDGGNWANNTTATNEVKEAYTLLNAYISGTSKSITYTQSETWVDGIKLSATWDFQHPTGENEKYDITSIEDTYYIDQYYLATNANLSSIFDEILNESIGSAFTPLSGDNDAGVSDSITYQDPLGEYMEIKNAAITTAPHHIDNSAEGDGTPQTYDMALLVFGEMHGLVRAGVYDFQWNDKYMKNHDEGVHGRDRFPMGWYKGEDAAKAYKADPEYMGGDESGTWPSRDPKTNAEYKTAEEAWADGWVMRFDFQTLLNFVPIADPPEDGLPSNLSDQMKNTVYTCYRFAGSKADRNALHRNPVYGEDIPQDLQAKWARYEETGDYPVGMGDYSGYPGVYRLSDIRVWEEHTGDFIDQSGAITPQDKSTYDDSLYVNIPVAAVPTQLAEITLGPQGPISYKDNLNDKTQSTPFRLFYAVGLTEDLIQRDSDGNQTGVDISKISGEYIANHSDPETNNIYFISNWYSNTRYSGYTSDEEENYRTRGDAAVSFSPDAENRYYLFQKPLPLFAHAWRVKNESGNVEPVDRSAGENWGVNKSGNGKTTWENSENPGTWSGGEFIGTYDNEDSFKSALNASTSESGIRYIKDNKGYTYSLPSDITDAIITFTNDQMKKVTSQGDGYTEDSISFSSDDYFFLCVEYYLPMDGVGVDINGNPVNGTHTVRKVTRLIARKGSEFGSGLHSENINNGDMLCWSDINGNCSIEIEYNSRTDTGDNTRGEPTFEKLTLTGNDLKDYLRKCGLKEEGTVTWTENGKEVQGTPLDRDVAYWESVQKDPHMAVLIEQIKESDDTEKSHPKYDSLFDWSVSAKTGGIRVGDMYQNIQPKGNDLDLSSGYYPGNVTKTANNYYIPTLSETSTAGTGLVIDNYLGNNGRLEIANSTLMVTKTLVAPDGFTMTNAQQNETFDYQVYIAGVSGLRSAQRLKWNPFSQSWQKRVESLDILTDNSSLVLDTNGNRALFCYADGIPRQVVEVFEDGKTNYYYADENGAATDTECSEAPEGLYYMYLPSEDNLTYRLFASSYEDGTTEIEGVGTTAYCPKGTDVGKLEGDNDNQKFSVENEERPAGSRDYWTSSAKLIPYSEVQAAEATDEILSGESGIAVMALEAESNRQWDYNKSDQTGHKDPGNFTLVTVIPDPTGTDSTVYSPFNSRTQYMSTELYFGYNKRLAEHLKEECTDNGSFAGCTHLEDYKLGGGDLYDQIVPTVDRPDLFTGLTNDAMAKNTAEFTLKSGEGLLFTGLGNRIPYRFTEKLTDEQMQKGYILKEISHVQQRGSDTVYMPGVQNVPVYKNGDGTVTWAIGQGGTAERTDITPQSEPFAHTNATIWESYATMAPGSLGNHHQPEASAGGVPAKNPSCNDAKTEAELDVGKCDLAQPDGSTRHYFYYGGKLVDPHYEGEMPGMSRYVLNPTAHFGVVNETVTSDPATNPESGYYDYTGVYSVYGDTGYFSEQAHYINTVSPEMLVLTKQLVDESGNIIDSPPDQEFEFTINLFESDKAAIKDNDNKLYIWRGNKNMLGKSPEEGGPPSLDKYQDYIPVDSADPTKTYLTELTPDETETIITYTVKLKANETVVIYGLAAGTNYSVEETPNKDYPVVGGNKHTDSGVYMQFGKIAHNSIDYVAMKPSETKNRTDFYNQVSTGSLTVEKYIMDDDRETVTNEFEFTVTLTPPSGTELKSEDLSAVKYGKDDAEVPDFTLKWENVTDAEGKVTGLTATFKLKHGEKVVINGIPLNTTYNVAETQKDGYNLQHVADNHEDKPDTKGEYLNLTNNSVNGNITAENSQAYLFFANGRAPYLPFAGGFGWMLWSILGTVLLLLPPIIYLVYKKRRSYP